MGKLESLCLEGLNLTIDCLVSLVRLRAFVLASLILTLAHHGRFDAIFKLVKDLILNHVSWDLFEIHLSKSLDRRLLRPGVSPFATIVEWNFKYCRRGLYDNYLLYL